MIHQSHVRLLLFVVSRWETAKPLSKDGPSQLVNSITFRPFFLFFAVDVHRFLPILSRYLTCAQHVFCALFSCLSIDSSLYHVIFSHVTVYSVFFVKVKVEFVTFSANFDYLYLY